MRLPFLALLAAGLSAQVRINEIQVRADRENEAPDKNHQWVELWNPTEEPVDLAGWKLTSRTGLAGESVIELPPLVLPPDHYLVIHIASGNSENTFTDGAASHFTQDDTSRDFWNSDSDAIALYSPDTIIDYFAWSSRAKALSEDEAAKDAAAARIWTRGASLNLDTIAFSPEQLVRIALPGQSLGRGATGADTNSPFDFDANGGGAGLATPGSRNYAPYLIEDEPVPFTEADEFKEEPDAPAGRAADDPPRRRKWTVMLYLACDDRTIQDVCLDYLRRIHRMGGSSDDVAFVALYDGYDNLRNRFTDENLSLIGMVPSGPESALPKYVSSNKAAGERPFYLLNVNGDRAGVAIPEQNTGHPNTLGGFITWARKYFPADRTMLVMAGHGRGWKSFGPDLSSPGQFAPYDALYLNEMRAAMIGAPFDILAFNSCLMADLATVYQFTGKARYFIGSEEVLGMPGFDFEAIHRRLAANPEISAEQLGIEIVETLPAHQSRYGRLGGNTLSLMDMREIPAVAAALHSFALSMRRGVPYLAKKDDPSDNAHTGMVEALALTFSTAGFGDTNFLDLWTYALNVDQNPKIPACAKSGATFLRDRINRAVIRQSNSLDRAGFGGISIYYPVVRTVDVTAGVDPNLEPYDYPDSRALSGDTRRVVYALNHDELPLKARSMEQPEIELNPRTEWPAPPSPGLLLNQHYREWPRYLERYYHPVADATILYGELPGGQRISPETVPAPHACGKPTDRIAVPVGARVRLSGNGSTDWDPGTPHRQPGPPYDYHWDTDSETECSLNCFYPSEVGDGADASLAARDNMDQDRIPDDTRWDDKNQSGPVIDVPCGDTPRQFFVTLFTWDDNHTFPFHNTLPSAPYVHPQTDRHTAEIICTPPPGTFGATGAQPFIQAGDLVRFDAAVVSSTGFGIGKLPIRIASTTNTRGMTMDRDDAESSTGRTPPGQNQASSQTPRESSTIPIPDGGGVWAFVSGRGTFTISFIAGNPGPASIVFEIPGLGQRTVSFTVVARLAPEPDEIVIFPPGNANVGVNANLIVEPRRNGQPLPDAIVTFLSPDNNAVFTNGTPFRSGRGTQVRNPTTGRTFAAIQAQVNGEIPIQILTGRLMREITIFGRGGPNTAVSRITALELPGSLTVGDRSRVVFGVFAGNERMPNQNVRITLVRGQISVAGSPPTATQFDLRTNNFGEAVLPFTVSGLATLEMTAAVTGTQLSTRVFTFVRPADE